MANRVKKRSREEGRLANTDGYISEVLLASRRGKSSTPRSGYELLQKDTPAQGLSKAQQQQHTNGTANSNLTAGGAEEESLRSKLASAAISAELQVYLSQNSSSYSNSAPLSSSSDSASPSIPDSNPKSRKPATSPSPDPRNPALSDDRPYKATASDPAPSLQLSYQTLNSSLSALPPASSPYSLLSSSSRPNTQSTPRNRAPRGARGIADNDTEEAVRWADVQSDTRLTETMAAELEETRQEVNRMTLDIGKREKAAPTLAELEILDKLTRKVQTLNDKLSKLLNALMEKIDILKGLQAANEAPAAEPLRRGGSSRDGAKTFDNDGPSNSPAPSSSVDREKSNLKRVSRESRGSLPPKDSAMKQESLGAQVGSGSTGSATNTKGKNEFAIGDEVAWRPKKETHQDWIQCNVIRVIGEGKSRRYDVQDPEPDEKTLVGAIHRTSASSMVAIPPPGSVLPDLAPKTAVLARYPDTTTFYTAEVIRMNGTSVILRFEGEDEPNQTTEVERRLVLDYPRQ